MSTALAHPRASWPTHSHISRSDVLHEPLHDGRCRSHPTHGIPPPSFALGAVGDPKGMAMVVRVGSPNAVSRLCPDLRVRVSVAAGRSVAGPCNGRRRVADSSLPAYDVGAAMLLRQRMLSFLDEIGGTSARADVAQGEGQAARFGSGRKAAGDHRKRILHRFNGGGLRRGTHRNQATSRGAHPPGLDRRAAST
jgi:hypothetical protein